MNKKIMILFLVLLTGFLFCDSNLMSQIDTDDFYYRNMRWEKPSKSGFEIKVFGIDYDLEYLDKRPNYERTDVLKNYYKENEKLTKNALLVLLKSDNEFILSSPGKDLHRYSKLYNNGTPMGETFFRVYSTGSGLGFDYKLIFYFLKCC